MVGEFLGHVCPVPFFLPGKTSKPQDILEILRFLKNFKIFENSKIFEKFQEFKLILTNFPFTSILLRPRNTLAAAGSCKTWFYLFPS